jgi:nifR3 family TIM-barrel protein
MPINRPYSPALQAKIDLLMSRRTPVQMGSVSFDSPLLLAPMSAICNSPFRQLMEELGAGGTVSELVSCHGINYGNQMTRKMLEISSGEKNIGIQLFGEDGSSMAEAAKVAQDFGPKFIDINMGCPVRKVVTKGSGSALLRETAKLGGFFSEIKSALTVPLTIKIRTGWDADSINALEIVRIAREEGVEFVAIHGRTRTQQYTGSANWDLLEQVAAENVLPIIGNGDLHSAHLVRERLANTKCQALMLGRGPLRDPFIFLTPFAKVEEGIHFGPHDYAEVIERLYHLMQAYTERERTLNIQMKKLIVWMATGFAGVSALRAKIFETPAIEDAMKVTYDFFMELAEKNQGSKQIDVTKPFMQGGHG